MYKINQGIITDYTGPRTVNVLQIPDNYIISNVRLPHILSNAFKPLKGSIVLVASPDSYKTFMIAVLRDPIDFLDPDTGLIGSTIDTEDDLAPGEIYMESAGISDPLVSGTGASFYIANDGTITLLSGKTNAELIIGGRGTDDDGEIYIAADNGFFEGNINHLTNVKSTFRFDQNNNLALGNYLTTVPPVEPIVEVPIGELTMDTLGNIVLRNATLGVMKDSLKFDAAGSLSLQNQFASLKIDTVGNVALNGSTINMNNGVFGVSRLNDTVTSNLSTDPTFWGFWSIIAAQIAALPVTPLDGGATLKAGLAALFGLMPQTILSKITTASNSVKAGN